RSSRPSILRASAARCNTSTERCNLALPLLAEGQHQHLLVDMTVLGQAAHRTAARIGEDLKSSAGLLIELRQRRDLWRLLAMHLEPELALEALILFRRDINGIESAVVALELMDLSDQRLEVIFFRRR